MSASFQTLARHLSIKTLPFLKLAQLARMAENIKAGLELGIPVDESYAMAAEDFATPAEKMAEASLAEGLVWLAAQDKGEIRELMIANEFLDTGR
jgi:hypothetical protein